MAKTLHLKNGRVVAITLATDPAILYGDSQASVPDASTWAVGDYYSGTAPKPTKASLGYSPAVRTNGSSSVERTYHLTGLAALTAGAGAGRSIDTQRVARGPFLGVRIRFENWSLTSTLAIRKFAVAPAAALNARMNTLTWTPGTFSGAAGTTIAQATGTGTGTSIVDVTAASVWSDIIPVQSLDRSDGGKYPILRIVTVYDTDTVVVSLAGTQVDAYNAEAGANGRAFAVYAQTGDAVATPTSSTLLNSGPVVPAAVEFVYAQPAASVAFFGDSITQGVGSASNMVGWAQIACDAITAEGALIVSPQNHGVAGATYPRIIANLKEVLAGPVKPEIAVFPAWSPNSVPTTDAVMLNCWTLLQDAVKTCRQNGVQPLVWASYPVSGYAADRAARVAAQIARVRALKDVPVIDFNAVMTDPANSVNIAKGMTDDNVHPSAYAHSKVGLEIVKPALKLLLGV